MCAAGNSPSRLAVRVKFWQSVSHSPANHPGEHIMTHPATLDDVTAVLRSFLEREPDAEWGAISIKRPGRPQTVLVVDPPPSALPPGPPLPELPAPSLS